LPFWLAVQFAQRPRDEVKGPQVKAYGLMRRRMPVTASGGECGEGWAHVNARATGAARTDEAVRGIGRVDDGVVEGRHVQREVAEAPRR
jgi:hypothetical protein